MINPVYTLRNSAPFPVITLENFIEKVARQIEVIGIDTNADVNPVIKNSIQDKLISSFHEFQHHLKPDKIILEQYANQFYGPKNTLLVLRFSKSKITEKLAFDNQAVPEDERIYFAQFDFNILYINRIKILYPNNLTTSLLSLRRLEEYDFDRTCFVTPSYCLKYYNGYEELWISGMPYFSNYFGMVDIDGIFSFFDKCGGNISPNYIAPDDILYRCDRLTIEALQHIVAFKVASENGLEDQNQKLEILAKSAYAKLEKTKANTGIKIG